METPYIKMWIEEGIIYCTYSKGLEMNLDIAQSCVRDRIVFSEGVSYPCLVDVSGIKSITKEARNYLSEEGAELIKAGAMITNTPLTKMLGNIFLTLNRPKIPIKLFSNKDEALAWLKKFV